MHWDKKNLFCRESDNMIFLSKIKWMQRLIKYRRLDIHVINIETNKSPKLVLGGFLKEALKRYKELNLKRFRCVLVFKALTGLKKAVILRLDSTFSPNDHEIVSENVQRKFEFLNFCHFDETVTMVEVSLHMVFIDDDFVDKWKKNEVYIWELTRMGYFAYKAKHFALL